MKENKIAGVYKITNIITGDFYIGSSKDIKKRWANHRSPSAHKQKQNSKLYKAMASYGLDNFTIEVIEKTDNLRKREQYWIEHLKPVYNNLWAKGQNIERHIKTNRRCTKDYFSRLCFYDGETLTLRALSSRFCRQGILHPTLNAKEYLL